MIGQGHKATVAFNMRPRRGPWGGGNQWLKLMVAYLEWEGYRVKFRLDPDVDCVLFTHAGLSGELAFRGEEVAAAKKRNPQLRVIHRINDNDIRKGSEEMDRILAETDKISDHTVFVSAWLRDYHAARWLDPARRTSVIQPGADPRIFHPLGNNPHRADGGRWRIVTHHWSDNPAKGFDVYAKIDRLIANGQLPDCELWIIGRWPTQITWRSARTFPACSGAELANLLRNCHIYVSASRYEPGAMHVAEGLQCGLPLLYTADTGGTVEVGRKFGVQISGDITAAIAKMKEQYQQIRRKLLQEGPCGMVMGASYSKIIQRLLAERELN